MNQLTSGSTDTSATPRSGARLAWLGLAALGAAYAVVRSKTQQAVRENPPAGKFLVADGVRLHYLEQGQGPALILLHGNLTMAADFRLSGLMDTLAQEFRVIAFDRPGYGYSERPRERSENWTPEVQARLLLEAAQQLGVEEFVLLGHSWGAMVAAAMALEAPHRVKGLLLLSGYYYPSMRLDVPGAALPAVPLLGDVMRFTASPLIGRALWPAAVRGAFSPSPVPDSFQRFPVWMALRPSQLRASAAEAALMVPAAARLEPRYAGLTMPLTIMAGEGDRVANQHDNSERLHQQLAHSSLHLLPGMGHMLHHLAQDEIVAELRKLREAADLQPSFAPEAEPELANGEAHDARPAPANGARPGL